MTPRIAILSVALFALPAITRAGDGRFERDGSYVTANFRTSAPTKELAERFGIMAEHYRKEKAMEWLGAEMPNWPERCPLKVELNTKQGGGATTFTFGASPGVQSQEMKIFGETKQLLYSVLPHEVTHTVFAHHFGRAVPRWADEGGSVLSENEEEWFNHDIRCREILNAGRGIKLRVLFTLKEYPKDMIVVYAQGYSVCDFLINQHKGGRAAFLKFVNQGMKNNNRNWEQAMQDVYGYNTVDEFEEAWIQHLKKPPQRIAARTKEKTEGSFASRGDTTPRNETRGESRGNDVRSSGLGGVPMLEAPGNVARGVPPDTSRGSESKPLVARPTARPDDRPPPIAMLLPPEPPRK
ncbi:hypothetical protein BH11PLA2_BH11PLA2_20070 [soil metagenome]